MDKWLRINIQKEAALGIEMVAEQLLKTRKDVYRWKWVIITLHNTLQNFMVLALRGTNNLKVLTDKEREKWLKAYQNDDKQLPQGKLDFFLNLYKKIQSNQMRQSIHSKSFKADKEFDLCVEKLNYFRNEFIHFIPKGWSIQLVGLPYISMKCIKIIEFLFYESGNVLMNTELESKVKSSLKTCLTELKDLDKL